MSLRLQQLKEIIHFPENNFVIDEWYSFVLVDVENNSKRIANIKLIKEDKHMNPKSAIAYLYEYFDKLEKDACQLNNTVCSEGCSSCCASDFDVSIVEYFAILRYMGIKFGEDFIKEFSQKAKMNISSPYCIFVNNANGVCRIYEVRPLICRKYGLYSENTFCPKLKNTKLLDSHTDTYENTILFSHPVIPNKRIFLPPKRLVYWFSDIKNGQLPSQHMKDLFYASFNKTLDEFVYTLFT